MASPNAGQRTLAPIPIGRATGVPGSENTLVKSVIELSLSPKPTQRITAIDSALSDIRKGNIGQIPDHLRDGHCVELKI